VVNSGANNELLKVNPINGQVVAMRNLDSVHSGGALFGLAATTNGMGQLQVYYDDSATNALYVLHAPNSDYASYAFARANGELSSFGMTGDGAPNFAANGVVGYAPDPSVPGAGWEVTSSGVVIPFGGAPSYGSIQTLGIAHLAAPIVGIAPTPHGQGYWLVGADGGVFTFGDAGFYGNTYTDGITGLGGARPLAKSILSIVPTPDGMGYWLLAADGGVFDFGNAQFWGSGPASGNTGPFTAAGPVSWLSSTASARKARRGGASSKRHPPLTWVSVRPGAWPRPVSGTMTGAPHRALSALSPEASTPCRERE